KPATAVLDHTLLAIANGGIHDQVGGGFHRYSTDRRWHVPHFEKMLYDNAQLAGLYVDAFARTGQPAFRAVAEGIFTYVLRDMTDPDGPFFSAQDAETDTIEGKYYVWSGAEIDTLLGADAKLFRRLFGVVDEPDFEHGNVLYRAIPLEQSIVDTDQTTRVAKMHQTLLATRIKRKPPLLDDKVLTSWNGLMIRSLADGGRVLKKPEYTQAATRAAEFLMAKLHDTSNGHLLRTYRQGKSKLHAYLVDYAFLVEGLLALHQATGDKKWLTEAQKLTDEQISLYWDKTRHGFYFTSHNHEELLARTQNGFDSVLPSGNSTSIRNLVRLAKRTGDAKYRTYAQQTLEAFAPQMREHQQRGGMGMSHMALALAEFLAK
ncbi:MAG: glycoside hydrolase family 47 protein, partial [Planctomycetota bacterium]|nr:glycoside hydrolase family 47 protein [Planctomycetota bacterium]